MSCIVGRAEGYATDFPVKRKLVALDKKPQHNVWGGVKFSMMTYNILAQLLVRRDIYGYCSKEALKVKHRRGNIMKEILDAHCDIICVQECDDYHIYWAQHLEEFGYDSVYVQKDKFKHAGKTHGCAIFWKRDKFEKVKYLELDFREISEDYEDDDVYDELDRKNVCHFVALHPISGDKRRGKRREKNGMSSTTSLDAAIARRGRGRRGPSGRYRRMRVDNEIHDHNGNNNGCSQEAKEGGEEGEGQQQKSSPRQPSLLPPSFVSDGFGIIVSNTHLFWNPKYSFVKLKQCEKLLSEILKFNEDLNYEFIIAGDFNTTPDNIIHTYLTKRTIAEKDLTMFLTPKDHGDRDAFRLSKLHGITNEDIRNNHTDINEERNQIRLAEVHELLARSQAEFPRLTSVYGNYTKLVPEEERDPESSCWSGEPPFTNYTKNWKGTLDYFFLPEEPQSTGCNLRATHVLSVPKEEHLSSQVALPNDIFGSDHVSLVSHFHLTKK